MTKLTKKQWCLFMEDKILAYDKSAAGKINWDNIIYYYTCTTLTLEDAFNKLIQNKTYYTKED